MRVLQKGMRSFVYFVEMTVSASGVVYVACYGNGTNVGGLVMYEPGKSAPHTITQGVTQPLLLSTGDPAGF